MNASDAHIENAYRTLVKVWHPDRFQADPKTRLAADEKLKEINAAHEFLISGEAIRPQARTTPKAPAPQGVPFKVEPPLAATAEPEPEPELEDAEIRRILKRKRKRTVWLPKFLLRAGLIVGVVAMVAILWLTIDAILMSNPRTAGAWEQHKAELGRDLHSMGLRIWGDATGNLHQQKDQSDATAAQPEPAAVPQQPPAANPAPPPDAHRSAAGGPQHINVDGSGHSAQPYVTSGLTTMEVLGILGTPTSSSGERMFYKGSEIDFKNGRVAGWKIDPKSAPLRVKLWPSAKPVPGLTQFAVGSSKSDVIALQGTPTLFSDNKFGYGNSVVLFQNDRVVGWNEDPNSMRLRVAH